MKVNCTGSYCMLQEYFKDNYYARSHTAIIAAVKCTLVLDDVNFDEEYLKENLSMQSFQF